MRIVILTPHQPYTTGNWVTANRYAKGLRTLGAAVKIIEVGLNERGLKQKVQSFKPDIVHLLHAYRTGAPWLACQFDRALPMAVTLTGTDIHQGMNDPQQAPLIERVFHRADAILSQNPLTVENLRQNRADIGAKVHYLPPGIELGTHTIALRKKLNIDNATVLLLLPASVRPVKGNLELFTMVEQLKQPQAPFHLAFCGPILDKQYGNLLQKKIAHVPWATYCGELTRESIPSAFKQADIICNNSFSEGLSNALVEARILGRPILARRIEGNQAVVKEEVHGLLYDTTDAFATAATALINDASLRQRLSHPDTSSFNPQAEAKQLLAHYTSLARSDR